MWLPTKYWIFLVISLKNAPVVRAQNNVTSSDEVSSSQSSRWEGLDWTTLIDYEIVGMTHSERGNGTDEKITLSNMSAEPHSKREDESRKNSYEPQSGSESTESHRKDRRIVNYSKDLNKYVKNLLSKSLGSLLSGLSGKSEAVLGESPLHWQVNDSQYADDVTASESQSKLVIRVDSREPEPEQGLVVPVANSLLSKINKGLNYTSTISKYLSSMPAVRSLTTTFTGAVSSIQNYFKLIKPGTQWCGDGDRAKSFEDLGLFYKTDACCREHDICPDFILAGSEKHGLTNDGVFTKLHCDCDVRFYQCLKSVHTPIALSTGFEYFNILKPTCFKKEYPVIGCDAFNKGKCVQYRYDSNHEKIWQWFENKEFL